MIDYMIKHNIYFNNINKMSKGIKSTSKYVLNEIFSFLNNYEIL